MIVSSIQATLSQAGASSSAIVAAEPLAAPIKSPGAIKYPDSPQPSLTEHIDPELGITVLQLRADDGTADSTIPNSQQLKAYAAAQSAPPSPKSHVA